ncbi:MAG: RNA polymerase sigma factor [Chloroflexota bacterium]|nr:MAG: hypothetical protein DLM70_10595 [Chloroflexota bacterium]
MPATGTRFNVAHLVDTSVFIAIERRGADLGSLARLWPGEDIAIAAITASELLESALLQEIDRLPGKQREAMVLRYYLDMDERTMSSMLSVPVGTVKWRLFQAHKPLRNQISEGHDMYRYLSEEGQRS